MLAASSTRVLAARPICTQRRALVVVCADKKEGSPAGKQQLVDALVVKMGTTKKDAELALTSVLAVLKDEIVSGNGASIVGFGAFKVKDRAARTGVNPQTREKLAIPARKAVSFTPGKNLKEEVNGAPSKPAKVAAPKAAAAPAAPAAPKAAAAPKKAAPKK